jgi:Xaa-Pro aminopeptidase
MKRRLARLRQLLREHGLEAIVITEPDNRRYLSGFAGSSGALLVSEDEAFLITSFVYLEQATRTASDFSIVRENGTAWLAHEFAATLAKLLAQVSARRIGFEGHHLTFAQHQAWTTVLGEHQLVAIEGLVEGIRGAKDESELALIKRAVAITDEAFHHLLKTLRLGMTEKQVAWEAERCMRELGAEKLAFDIIVASGPNGAMPHAVPSERAIRQGEPIVIDMGARVDGYHSDLSRTVCLGRADERFLRIYDIVLQAQESAEEGIRVGMSGREVDALARQVITEVGYGEFFGHGLGHGVGLSMRDELPSVTESSDDLLQVGSVFTVEPGIYIPPWGGVRIEDVVAVGEEGAQVLSAASKEPILEV